MSETNKPKTPNINQQIDAAIEKKRAETAAVGAATRRPFGSMQPKLAIPADWITPNHRPYWFVDKPGRIARALEAGYKHIKDRHTGQPMKYPTGINAQGEPEHSYAMEIPNEWFEQDMREQQNEVNERERGITKADHAQLEGKYIPTTGISIKHNSNKR